MNTRRYPRTRLEAWPTQHPGSIYYYRRPLAERVAGWIRTAAVLGLFAGIGAMLAWRG